MEKNHDNYQLWLFVYEGCPSPVANSLQCSNPCPENCEECFPGTGICIKCKHGFEGNACEIGKPFYLI